MTVLRLDLVAYAVVIALAVVTARAETINCTPISALPATISNPGIYCLTSNLSTSQTTGAAISIDADDVVLDLNGHVLDGSGPVADAWSIGILGDSRRRATVRNGVVRGFTIGVALVADDLLSIFGQSLVEDIRAVNNAYIGIIMVGFGQSARGNAVIETGGTILTSYTFGIDVDGRGCEVVNNDVIVTNAPSGGQAFGIIMPYGVTESNRVAIGNTVAGGTSYGFRSGYYGNSLAIANSVSQFSYGVYYGSYYSSRGKYRNNLTTGVTTPYTGGTNAGGNN